MGFTLAQYEVILGSYSQRRTGVLYANDFWIACMLVTFVYLNSNDFEGTC